MATWICKISVQNHFVPPSVVFKDWVTWFLASAMLPPKVKYLIKTTCNLLATSVVFKDWVTWFLASAMLPPKVKYLIKTTCNLLKRYSIHMYYMYYYVNKISLYSTVISQ